jgi:hypothetical protein
MASLGSSRTSLMAERDQPFLIFTPDLVLFDCALNSAPTSCSWLNAVEGFFAKLSKQRLKRGVFRSVVDLQITINRFLNETNQMPKPFTWTADPDKIIAAVKRGHQVLDSVH